MAISFQAIGQKIVSFAAASGLTAGKPCIVSANETVSRRRGHHGKDRRILSVRKKEAEPMTFDHIRLEKGMYRESGRSFTQVLERLDPS